jgi:hypothetical protein
VRPAWIIFPKAVEPFRTFASVIRNLAIVLSSGQIADAGQIIPESAGVQLYAGVGDDSTPPFDYSQAYSGPISVNTPGANISGQGVADGVSISFAAAASARGGGSSIANAYAPGSFLEATGAKNPLYPNVVPTPSLTVTSYSTFNYVSSDTLPLNWAVECVFHGVLGVGDSLQWTFNAGFSDPNSNIYVNTGGTISTPGPFTIDYEKTGMHGWWPYGNEQIIGQTTVGMSQSFTLDIRIMRGGSGTTSIVLDDPGAEESPNPIVPEPASIVLCLIGVAFAAFLRAGSMGEK